MNEGKVAAGSRAMRAAVNERCTRSEDRATPTGGEQPAVGSPSGPIGAQGSHTPPDAAATAWLNSGDPARFEKSDGASGTYRLDLTSKNRQVIGQTESYDSASARDNGIEAVARAAKGADTVDLTA